MAPIGDCSLPPNIILFRVIESGPRFVRLVWAHQYLFKSAYKFNYELDWWSQDEPDSGTLPTKLILNHRAKTALISDLHPRSSYGSRLLIRNDCGRTHPLNLNFSTKPEVLHSTITRAMPHEIVLIVLILLIWLMILRHFIRKYNKMTFVSPHTAFIHGRRYSDQKTNKTSDVDSLRRGSEISKASVTNKFDLLEDVVCRWRSETVLENRMPIHNRDVAHVMDKTDMSSNYSSEHGSKFPMSRAKRRRSNATDDLRMLTLTSNTANLPKLSTSSVRPSQSYPLFTRIGSSSVLNSSPICPEIYYEDYDNIIVPPCSPAKFPPQCDEEEELERCRLLAKLSGPRDSSGLLQSDGMMRRKVSEILLGKATIDIRRCSSISAYIRRPKAQKHALVRRQSLFQSFRKSFRRKRPSKSQGCSVSGLNSVNNMSNRWFRNFQLSPTDRPDSQLLDTPPYRRRKDSTARSDKCVKMQISTESYFTAADVLIHIEGED